MREFFARCWCWGLLVSKVIEFPQPEPRGDLIWRCDCGCLTNYLHSDGTVECARCGATGVSGDWRADRPEPSSQLRDVEAGDVAIVDLQDSRAALLRVLSRARDEAGDIAFVVVGRNSGGISVWGDAETDEQVEWLDRRLAEARALLDRRAKG